MDECPICEKHRGVGPFVGDVLYEDETLVASHALPLDGPTAYLGYVFVESRRHVRGLADLTEVEASRLGAFTTRLARALEDTTGAEAVCMFVFDQTPHHHRHLVSRYAATPREYWGTKVVEWPEAPHGGRDAIRELSDRIRSSLGA